MRVRVYVCMFLCKEIPLSIACGVSSKKNLTEAITVECPMVTAYVVFVFVLFTTVIHAIAKILESTHAHAHNALTHIIYKAYITYIHTLHYIT